MDYDDLKKNMDLDVDEAQPIKKSELLPIYENMKFAGDIQPVNDVAISERIELSYSKNEPDNSENKNPLSSKKKIKIPLFKRKTSVFAIILTSFVLLVMIGGAFFGIRYAKSKNGGNGLIIKSVYVDSNNSTVIVFSDGSKNEISSVQKSFVSDDGKFLYYTKFTASKTGKYDLYAIDVSNDESLKKGGTMIEVGVDDGWQVTDDGKFACYSTTENTVASYYMFSLEKNKSEIISDEVEQAFLPCSGDVVYFTNGDDTNNSLQRKRMGENAELVANKVSYVNMFKDKEGFEIIYTIPTEKTTNVDIWITDGVSEPQNICKNVSEVYLNDYTYGGNLYYFIKDESNVSWQDFIEDDYYDYDVTLEKPVEGDFMVEKGFFIKRYVLDSNEYNNALNNYNEKLTRDSVREALNDLDLGLTVKDKYSGYVYSKSRTTKLINGVTLDNIIDFSKTDDPRIIFRKSTIGVENKISLDKLVSIAKEKDVDSAIDYVRDMISGSYELNDNCNYTWFDSNKVLSYTISEYDMDAVEFIFGSRDILYALCDSELYYNSITSSELSKRTLIDTGVEEPQPYNNCIYYLKKDSSGNKAFYKFTADMGKEKLSDSVYSYFISTDNVIVLSKNNEKDTVNVDLYRSSSYENIDNDISLDKFKYSEKSFSYLKNYSGNSGGDLYCYSYTDGVKNIAKDAVNIIYTE